MWMKCTSVLSYKNEHALTWEKQIWPIHSATVHQLLHFCHFVCFLHKNGTNECTFVCKKGQLTKHLFLMFKPNYSTLLLRTGKLQCLVLSFRNQCPTWERLKASSRQLHPSAFSCFVWRLKILTNMTHSAASIKLNVVSSSANPILVCCSPLWL